MDNFSKAYLTGKWGVGSGPGSYEENTREYREFLQKYIIENNVKSIIDIGCGDWQIFKLIQLDKIKYEGYDCVSAVIEANSELYASTSIRFECLNVIELKNRLKADLVIVKDVFQHLSFESIRKIWNIIESNSIIVVDDATEKDNTDVMDGDYRALNLHKCPFKVKVPPLFSYIIQNNKHADKCKSVYLLNSSQGLIL